jgi:hypothetical protein
MNGDTTPRRPHIRRALIRGTLAALAAALVLTGCGGSSGSGSAGATSSTSAASTTPTSASLSAFQTCLKQHGVTVRPGQFSARPRASFTPTAFPTRSPRPGSSFFGTDSAAFKACAKYAPAGFGRGFGGRTISSSALAAFKSCLGQNGVKVTGTTASAVLSELRKATGKAAAAVRTCRVLLQPTAPSPSPSS